ncbi:type VI secretion system baseplate subunit TssF [Xenorhabdus sp. 42]|uniref:Type VI secretion system baseplate subunit TssF n=1 Tax=Xenorhabdus szentirmaii TaxID=290112 RepID=A0AAW3Z250_9GAMM|nr:MULTISPECIES: type VI secretion system baseplate subunit TssF [unclassified Xenorhabdus]MBD2803024.1 type VI secretion system baseplate subunit TssF [Xenorhabdus sp. M]MBD2821829.1 type VI secretion system baseplate subunit TssF [Xenorhabdus sp. 42]
MKNRKESLYLQELAYLREKMKLAAAENPHLAEFLEHPNDPDILRLLEGFALLSSNLRSKIGDTYPEVSHETLARIWPHTLRPVPPTAIIQFTPHQGVHQGAVNIPKSTPVTAADGEQNLPFHTCRDLPVEPFVVRDKQIQKTREYSDIVLTLHRTGNVSPGWSGGKLHFFLGTDKNRAAQLSLWLDMHIDDFYLRTAEGETRLRNSYSSGWGVNFQHTLLPTEKLPFTHLQQMTEYYCLPHVFNFITLDINGQHDLQLNPDNTCELIFRLQGELPIDELGDAFQLGCVPAIHLEPMVSPAISLEPDNARYPLALADTARLFRIDSIRTAKQPGEKAAQGSAPRGKPCCFLPIDQFQPKSDWLLDAGDPDNVYFQSRVTDDLLGQLHNQVHFTGMDGKAANNLSPQTVCAYFTGFHIQAMQLGIGEITHTPASVPAHLHARNITAVSPDFPPMVMGKSDWSLINLLNCPPFLLFDAASLKAFLRLYDCYAEHDRTLSRRMQQHINGIVRIDARSGARLDYTKQGQGRSINGNTLHLYLDPACYDNDGIMYQFCRVIDELLACFVVRNNFILLNIYRQGEQQALWTFRQRTGLRSEM